jgi:GNAT superfamily N-acetyltransferase
MTLYKHYKNLPYRLLDIVKHSETMEELVLYRPLYDKPYDRLWVRPKAMFFESIEVQGKKQPRFAKADLEVRIYKRFEDEVRIILDQLGPRCFESWTSSDLDLRTQGKQSIHIAIGHFEGKPVAFKLGYEISKDVYYSWLGGVDPAYHRFGFASRLAEVQHDWAVAEGFQTVQTKCLNFNIPMLQLNLKHGFLIIDTELTELGLKLILEKRIREAIA